MSFEDLFVFGLFEVPFDVLSGKNIFSCRVCWRYHLRVYLAFFLFFHLGVCWRCQILLGTTRFCETLISVVAFVGGMLIGFIWQQRKFYWMSQVLL